MISLVIRVFNEEILIEELFKRVQDSMRAIISDFKVILVDDGSTDNIYRNTIALLRYHTYLLIIQDEV